jgi:hypothetical protein
MLYRGFYSSGDDGGEWANVDANAGAVGANTDRDQH